LKLGNLVVLQGPQPNGTCPGLYVISTRVHIMVVTNNIIKIGADVGVITKHLHNNAPVSHLQAPVE